LFSPAFCNWIVHFVWNALGQRGSVGTGFGPMAFVGYGGLQPPYVLLGGQQACGLQPPWASPAPMLRRRSSSGICSRPQTRLRYLPSPSMLFSLYISLVFSISCIDRQLSFVNISLLHSTDTNSATTSGTALHTQNGGRGHGKGRGCGGK
jgi:hypothetical protein